MAESLDDGEFWLPPQFLTDDDTLMEKSSNKIGDLKGRSDSYKDLFGFESAEFGKSLFPYEFPYGFGSFSVSSDLSSPVESVVGSTETESDEEDYLAGLTRQMAHSTLGGDFKRNDLAFGTENSKGWVVSGSPQSTLCALGSGCGCRQGSSHGSPNGSSRVSSPPPTWDLLHAAAGEVERMRMNTEEGYNNSSFNNQSSRGILGPPRKPSPISIPSKNPNPDVSLYPLQSLSYQKLQATQQLRQQQILNQLQQQQSVWGGQNMSKGTGVLIPTQQSSVVQNRGRNSISSTNVNRGPLGLSASAWPPLQANTTSTTTTPQQQQPSNNHGGGSGMRAVFLGNPGVKRECAGTGVFLPRRISSTPAESRKKQACSTVLLPARVVQALNLNLENMGAQAQFQPWLNGSSTPESDVAAVRLRNANILSYQKRSARPQPAVNNEVRLPQEWTY